MVLSETIKCQGKHVFSRILCDHGPVWYKNPEQQNRISRQEHQESGPRVKPWPPQSMVFHPNAKLDSHLDLLYLTSIQIVRFLHIWLSRCEDTGNCTVRASARFWSLYKATTNWLTSPFPRALNWYLRINMEMFGIFWAIFRRSLVYRRQGAYSG
jgi:hypothetical protein